MRKHRHTFAILLLMGAIVCFTLTPDVNAAGSRQTLPPPLARQDAVLIAEAYHLWQTLGEKLWTGWTAISIPFIYITSDYEYAIGFPKKLAGFTQLGEDALLNKSVQARKRIFGTHSAASFPYEDVPAVVIGTPAALEKSPAAWVLTASHEMFHVLQYSRGSSLKVAQLKIGRI